MAGAMSELQTLADRLATRAGAPCNDEVAGRLSRLLRGLITTNEAAAASQLAAEHSDSHGRLRAMSGVQSELQAAAKALQRAGETVLRFYFE